VTEWPSYDWVSSPPKVGVSRIFFLMRAAKRLRSWRQIGILVGMQPILYNAAVNQRAAHQWLATQPPLIHRHKVRVFNERERVALSLATRRTLSTLDGGDQPGGPRRYAADSAAPTSPTVPSQCPPLSDANDTNHLAQPPPHIGIEARAMASRAQS
jgi:hypothetical protein